jgi:VanZ family protein
MNVPAYLRSNPRINLALIVGCAATIFALSATPAEDIPAQLTPYSALLHAMEYSALGFLAYPYAGGRRPLLAAVAASALFGVSDELHQLFVPGRVCSAEDAVVDFLGSALGAMAAKLWGRV